jgi:hypothetical protein
MELLLYVLPPSNKKSIYNIISVVTTTWESEALMLRLLQRLRLMLRLMPRLTHGCFMEVMEPGTTLTTVVDTGLMAMDIIILARDQLILSPRLLLNQLLMLKLTHGWSMEEHGIIRIMLATGLTTTMDTITLEREALNLRLPQWLRLTPSLMPRLTLGCSMEVMEHGTILTTVDTGLMDTTMESSL